MHEKSQGQDQGDVTGIRKDLEVLATPPKEFWETVKYFGKGIRESVFHSLLVIVALILLVVTLPTIYYFGGIFGFLAFLTFAFILIFLVKQGALIQEAGRKREVRPWVEANRARAYFEEPARNSERTSRATRATLKKCLEVYRDFVAVFLDLHQRSVRTNIFLPNKNGALVIPHGMDFNMDDPNELTIKLLPGEGCTGSAYSLTKPVIATRETPDFPYGVPMPERAKVNEKLQWILSLPIFAGREVIGVLNVDGRDTPKTKDELRSMVPSVRPWATLIGGILEPQSKE